MVVARWLVLGGALLVGAASPAQAGWFRDTVQATLTARGGLAVTTPFGPPAAVRAGTTFSGQVMEAVEGLDFDISLDVGPYEIVVRVAAGHGRRLADPGDLVDITLSGLSPVPRILLTSFTCPTPEGFCQWPESPLEATLTDNLPTALVLGFSALEDGATYVYAIPAPNQVPAPGAWPLMLTGLLGLAAGAWRRGGGSPAARRA